MSLRKTFFKSGLWAFGGKIISIISAFMLNLVLTHSLTPSDYGAYFVAFNTVIIMATFATFGVDQSIIRFIAIKTASKDMRGLKTIICQSIIIVLTGVVAVCVIYYFGSTWFFTVAVKAPAVAELSGLMILWIIFATVQRQLAEVFRGLKDIRAATLFGGIRNNGIIISVASACVTVAVYSFGGLNLTAIYSIMCLTSAFVVILAFRFLVKIILEQSVSQNKFEGNSVTCDYYNILQESWPLWGAAIIGVMRTQGDAWFAAFFDEQNNVALYGAAQRFVALVMAPLVIFNALLPPYIAEMHAKGELKRLEKLVRTVTGVAGLPAIAIMVALVFFGQSIMSSVFGAFYGASYLLLVVLGVGQLINVLTGSCFIVLAMSGHKNDVMRITIISAFALAIFAGLGGHYFGVYGVASGAALATVIHNIMGVFVVKKRLGIWTFVSLDMNLLRDIRHVLLDK